MKSLLVSITILMSITSLSQTLTLNDLQTFLKQKSWNEINRLLVKKNWEYHKSDQEGSISYGKIVWAYEKSRYSDEALGWLTLYTFNNEPVKLEYEVFNSNARDKIENNISSLGYKSTRSEVLNDVLETDYANSNYYFEVRNVKDEDDTWSSSSVTRYQYYLIKKSSVYDPENGDKVSYYDNGQVMTKYRLKNGEFNGPVKVYFESGGIKREAQYVNGKINGEERNYYQNGALESKYQFKNDVLHGSFTHYYESGEVKVTGYFKNGSESGKFTFYDENGNITKSYNSIDDVLNGEYCRYKDGNLVYKGIFKNGKLNGPYENYLYYENGNYVVEKGNYENDMLNGYSTVHLFNGEEKILHSYTNYLNDKKHGECKDVYGEDSIVIANYAHGVLNGPYEKQETYKSIESDINFGFFKTEEGNYLNGLKEGTWNYYSFEQLRESGKYINGKKEGEWKIYVFYGPNKNKVQVVSNFKNGKLHGATELFFEEQVNEDNDVILVPYYEKNNYVNGLLHGESYAKDSLNRLIYEGQHDRGKETGKWTIRNYDNGITQRTYVFVNGEREGPFEETINNHLSIKGKYRDDQQTNKWFYFDTITGNIDFTIIYSKGVAKEVDLYEDEVILSTLFLEDDKTVKKYDYVDGDKNKVFKIVEAQYGRRLDLYTVTTIEGSVKTIKNYKLFVRDQDEIDGYEDGVLDGESKVYVDDILKMAVRFTDDKLNGECKYYLNDEGVQQLKIFNYDKLVNEEFRFTSDKTNFSGNLIVFDLLGEKVEEIKVKEGKRHGITKKFDNGKLIEKVKYKNGLRK